jgi:hypothetical protein
VADLGHVQQHIKKFRERQPGVPADEHEYFTVVYDSPICEQDLFADQEKSDADRQQSDDGKRDPLSFREKKPVNRTVQGEISGEMEGVLSDC